MEQLSLKLKSGVEASRVRMSHLREAAFEMGLRGRILDSFIRSLSLLAKLNPQLSSSKTYQVYYLPTEEEISESFSRRWPRSGMLWDGACLTADISESPNHAVDSSLLDIIETQSVPARYYLSPNAAVGMLRRANAQGRPLFPPLRKALETLARAQSSSE